MAEKIPFQDGIEAFRLRANDAVQDSDPELEGDAWPDKLAATLETLKNGHNEYEDRLTAIEQTLLSRPF